jgi:chorismate mutase/N-acetylglutamate synthase-like GNAT family acetyltransferase
MKKAEDCKSIEEIRECIDELDKTIIRNLGIRSTFVKMAARLKKSEEDVRAKNRVESMIKDRRKWASEYGLNPEFIEMLYRNIIAYFIGKEMAHWGNEEDNSEAVQISLAHLDDAGTILSLQKRAYVQEAELNDNNFNIPPMLQDIESMINDFSSNTILKAKIKNRIVGSVRAKQVDTTCYIGRLIVEPIYQSRGIGKKLLHAIENHFSDASVYELFTGLKSLRNREFYKKAGYVETDEYDAPDGTRMVRLRKYKE